MRHDHAVLVEQRQPARGFEHALDHEHHVRAAGVIFVEHQRDVVLYRPGQDAVAELGDLLAVLEHDRVLADEIDAAHMRVEVDADERPVQPRRHLLDMGGFAGAVIALHHDAAVEGEACQDRQRRVAVEQIVRIGRRHMRAGLRIAHHLHVAVDPEGLADRIFLVGQIADFGHLH